MELHFLKKEKEKKEFSSRRIRDRKLSKEHTARIHASDKAMT
jgi:hypothetical protein